MDERIAQAGEMAQSGDRPAARALLQQVLRADPRNEPAWLLYANIAASRGECIEALEACIRLMPEARRARAALDMLLSQPGEAGSAGWLLADPPPLNGRVHGTSPGGATEDAAQPIGDPFDAAAQTQPAFRAEVAPPASLDDAPTQPVRVAKPAVPSPPNQPDAPSDPPEPAGPPKLAWPWESEAVEQPKADNLPSAIEQPGADELPSAVELPDAVDLPETVDLPEAVELPGAEDLPSETGPVNHPQDETPGAAPTKQPPPAYGGYLPASAERPTQPLVDLPEEMGYVPAPGVSIAVLLNRLPDEPPSSGPAFSVLPEQVPPDEFARVEASAEADLANAPERTELIREMRVQRLHKLLELPSEPPQDDTTPRSSRRRGLSRAALIVYLVVVVLGVIGLAVLLVGLMMSR